MTLKGFIMAVVGFAQLTLAHGMSAPASVQEQREVIASFQRPTNNIAKMLRQVMAEVRSEMGAQPIQFKVVKTSVADHFNFEIQAINTNDGNGVLITGEVLVRQGTAYVFHFKTERLVMAQKWPGVGMGTR